MQRGCSIMQDAMEAFENGSTVRVATLVGSLLPAAGAGGDVFDEQCMRDIEALRDYDGGVEGSVARAVDRSNTEGGALIFDYVLSHPVDSAQLLRRRQEALRSVTAVLEANREATTRAREAMMQNEQYFAWFAQTRTAEEQELLSTVYYSMDRLNDSDVALNLRALYKVLISPLVGVVTPVVYFIIPFFILRIKFGLRLSITDYVRLMYQTSHVLVKTSNVGKTVAASYMFSMVFYFQGVFSTLEVSNMYRRVIKIMHARCNGIGKFVRGCRQLLDLYGDKVDCDDFGVKCGDAEGVLRGFSGVPEELDVLSGSGKVMRMFRGMDVRAFAPAVRKAYLVDALIGVASSVGGDGGMCYAEYVERKTPMIRARGMWHTCLGLDSVRNSIKLGDSEPNSAIVTGPNAGGKSTFVKSLLVNVLLAQTFGVAAARRLTLTPFVYVSSQMNVPDCKGRESLFEAEMNRCKQKLDAVRSRKGHVLIAMDEVFSSTEPTEGLAGAYAVVRAIVRNPNVVCVITTHFRGLCELGDEEDIENYQMAVGRGADGEITFPYKVARGVSDQHIALELLRKKGFDPEIVDAAVAHLVRLRGQMGGNDVAGESSPCMTSSP